MANWYEIRAAPIQAVEDGVAEADGHFRSSQTGPTTFENLDYPHVTVLPEETNRTGGTTWQHSIAVFCIFERTRRQDYFEDVLAPVAHMIDAVLDKLGDVECITDYHPESIQDFAGELDQTGTLNVLVRFRATTQVDPGEF